MNHPRSSSRGGKTQQRPVPPDPWDLIVPYVDDECDAAERSWLEEEIRRDPLLAHELEVHTVLKDTLATVYRRLDAVDNTCGESRELAGRVRRAARARRRRKWWVASAAAAAAVIAASVLAIGLHGTASRSSQRDAPSTTASAERTDAELAEMLNSLDILEVLLDQDVEVTPELTEMLLQEDDDRDEGTESAAGNDEAGVLATDAEKLLDYLLEEELMWDY